MDKFAGGTRESYGSAYHPCGLAFCDYADGDDYDTWSWEPGRDPRQALCHHGDAVEDGLSECETVFACLDCD